MKTHLWTALRTFTFLTLLSGVFYPALVTGLGQTALREAANGSMLADKAGEPVGSALVGQSFSAPGAFWGRLSQTAERPYNSAASGGSNLGTSNPALGDNAKARLDDLQADGAAVPSDLVTSSGSGLDPHISPEAAYLQIPRVAQATGHSPEMLKALVDASVEPRTFGILGQPRVNVLSLNQQLLELN